MLWLGEVAGEAHADECVGQLFEGVRQPLVVCFERMSPLPTITAIDGSVGGGSTQRRGGCNEGGKSPRRLIDSIDRKVVQWLCNGS